MNIGFVGAKGGQGTSTIAASVALGLSQFQAVHLRSDQPSDLFAIVGMPDPIDTECVQHSTSLSIGTDESERLTVTDYGTNWESELEPTALYAVVRGPCYIALRRLLTMPRPNGIIIVAEEGRSLGRRDVEDVIGVPVIAEVPVNAAVARSVDAGLFGTRVPKPFHLLNLHFTATVV